MRALAGLLGVGSAAVVLSLLGELFARHVLRSTHVVYYLVDKAGVVLYIGETDNIRRRYREHLNPNQEPAEWRRHVVNMAVVKYCWSRRQGKRVERRMCKAVTEGAYWRMCPPLNNWLLVKRTGWLSLSRLWWLGVYWLNGCLWPAARWHKPNPAGWSTSPPHEESNGVGGTWAAAQSPSGHDRRPVHHGDGPQVAPLGALTAGDMSPAGDTTTVLALPPAPETPRKLRVVPTEGDDLPAEEPARTRERNRRNQAAKRRRVSAQARAAE